jgi:uncharacterized protein (DUF927 family)
LIADGVTQFLTETLPADAAGQAVRVARRFGVVAAAGELAAHYGLTGWPEGEASRSARGCFETWLSGFGGSDTREVRSIRAQVRAFFEAHGASRFEPLTGSDMRVTNRAGFVRENAGVREYLVLPQVYTREVCKGLDAKEVTKVLIAGGWLEPEVADGKTKGAQKVRIAKLGPHPTRCYVFTPRLWEGDE